MSPRAFYQIRSQSYAMPVCSRIREVCGAAFFAAALASAIGVPRASAQANNEHILFPFDGTDGAYPEGGILAKDTSGNFYGAVSGGGASGDGAIFELSQSGTESVLYSFTGGGDGSIPIGGVIRDKAGNLYGTALHGGTNNSYCTDSTCGTVWKLTPDGTLSVLYTFTGGSDGGNPFAGLILDKKGNLYGTTEQGGSGTDNCGPFGCGVVFKVDPTGTETVLYNFRGYQDRDGDNPNAGLTMDETGNLYGTTFQGGTASCDCGTVFKLAPDGTETVLHRFNGSDGNGPVLGSLILDASGSIYGTTDYQGPNGCGVAFKLSPKGKETVLHGFACGNDGGYPFSGLVEDQAGNLYGTTSSYGANNHGVVFELAPGGSETVLYAFSGGNDGASPYTGLLATKRHVYGGTYSGGGSGNCSNGCGTIFEVKK